MLLHLRPATKADLPSVVRVDLAAFGPDPIYRTIFPPHLRPADNPSLDERPAFREATTRQRFQRPRVHTLVAVDDAAPGDGIVGFTQWEAPAGPETEDERGAEKETQARNRAEWPASMDKDAFEHLHEVYHGEEVRLFGEKGSTDAWYCIMLCVHPDHERRGIGRMLCQWGIDKAASEGKDCILFATKPGVPLYKRLRFEDVGHPEVFGVPYVTMLIRAAES